MSNQKTRALAALAVISAVSADYGSDHFIHQETVYNPNQKPKSTLKSNERKKRNAKNKAAKKARKMSKK